jgi:hypothetical protein
VTDEEGRKKGLKEEKVVEVAKMVKDNEEKKRMKEV